MGCTNRPTRSASKRADTARALLPEVVDDGWFFDTELLVVAQRHGLRIVELPVDWTDDPDSRVDIVPTAMADLRGMWRLLRHPVVRPTLAAGPGADLVAARAPR